MSACMPTRTPSQSPISFLFESDPGLHICEVQLVHKKMLTARKHCNAHSAYSKFRSALELLETFGLMNPGPDDVEATHEFVQELDREYAEFMTRYQQKIKVVPNPTCMPIPNSAGSISIKALNYSTLGKTTQVKVIPHTDMTSLSDLQEEVRQLRCENEEQCQKLKHFQTLLENLQLQIDKSD